MLDFEKFKTELVVPRQFAPEICFLVSKSFIQNNPSNSTFITVKINVSNYTSPCTHTGIYVLLVFVFFFLWNGTANTASRSFDQRVLWSFCIRKLNNLTVYFYFFPTRLHDTCSSSYSRRSLCSQHLQWGGPSRDFPSASSILLSQPLSCCPECQPWPSEVWSWSQHVTVLELAWH